MYSHGQIAWFIFPQSSWMVLLVRMISPKCTDIHIYTLGITSQYQAVAQKCRSPSCITSIIFQHRQRFP